MASAGDFGPSREQKLRILQLEYRMAKYRVTWTLLLGFLCPLLWIITVFQFLRIRDLQLQARLSGIEPWLLSQRPTLHL
ncbi:MAG TPA: hypothetical protein VG944_17160 [Fimbriimonas sp.]|nr:hypothetical protein [Fimbriimonas sp.]